MSKSWADESDFSEEDEEDISHESNNEDEEEIDDDEEEEEDDDEEEEKPSAADIKLRKQRRKALKACVKAQMMLTPDNQDEFKIIAYGWTHLRK